MIAQPVGIAVGLFLVAAPAVFGYAGTRASDVHRTLGPIAASLAFIALWQATKAVRLPNLAVGATLVVAPVIVHHDAEAAAVALTAGLLLVAAIPFAGPDRRRLGGGWRAAWPFAPERSSP